MHSRSFNRIPPFWLLLSRFYRRFHPLLLLLIFGDPIPHEKKGRESPMLRQLLSALLLFLCRHVKGMLLLLFWRKSEMFQKFILSEVLIVFVI